MSTIESNPTEVSHSDAEQPRLAPSKPSSTWLLAGLAAAVTVLGTVIFSGIRERDHAETTLGASTERAAIATVNVVQPTSGAVSQEVVLPGNTQAFNDTPIYARTNGYLKRWYVDIGVHVAQDEFRLHARDRSGCQRS